MSNYLVIKFLVLPSADVDEHVCVPEAWQRWKDTNGEVAIAFPEESPTLTMERVLKFEDCSNRWKIYMAKVLHKKDSLQEALKALAQLSEDCKNDLSNMLSNMKIEKDEKNSSAKKIKQENNNITSTSIKKEKEDDNTKPKKPRRSSVNKTPEKVEDTNVPTTSYTGKAKKKPNIDEIITNNTDSSNVIKLENIESPLKKNRLSSGKKTPKKSNDTNVPSTSYAESSTSEPNIGPSSQNIGVDTVQKNKPKCSPFKIPPDFDPKDRTHMFRHPGPGEGILELLPETNVYIEARDLRVKHKNFTEMAKGLMRAIFTDRALKICTLSGEPPISTNHSERETRPGIDQTARETIIRYVYDNCYKHFKEGRNAIENAMRKELR